MFTITSELHSSYGGGVTATINMINASSYIVIPLHGNKLFTILQDYNTCICMHGCMYIKHIRHKVARKLVSYYII